jgi:hypothetical protein
MIVFRLAFILIFMLGGALFLPLIVLLLFLVLTAAVNTDFGWFATAIIGAGAGASIGATINVEGLE